MLNQLKKSKKHVPKPLFSMHECIASYAFMHNFSVLHHYLNGLVHSMPLLNIIEAKSKLYGKAESVFVQPSSPLQLNDQESLITTHALRLNPLRLVAAVHVESKMPKECITLRLDCLNGHSFSQCCLKKLTVFVDADLSLAFQWLQQLTHPGNRVFLTIHNQKQEVTSKLKIAYATDIWRQPLLPTSYSLTAPLMLLYDFSCLPEKYCYFNLIGLETLSSLQTARACQLDIHFACAHTIENKCIASDIFKLHCVPAIAMRSIPIEPIAVNEKRGEYRVKPMVPLINKSVIYGLHTLCARDQQGLTTALLPWALTSSGVWCEWRPRLHERWPSLYLCFPSKQARTLSGTLWCATQLPEQKQADLTAKLAWCDPAMNDYWHVNLLRPFRNRKKIKKPHVGQQLRLLNQSYQTVFKNVLTLQAFLFIVMPHAKNDLFIRGICEVCVSYQAQRYKGVLLLGHELRLVCDSSFYPDQAVLIQWGLLLYYYYLSCLPAATLAKLILKTSTGELLYEWHDVIEV